MKKLLLLVLILPLLANAQVTTTPDFPTEHNTVTITYDATKGNSALQGAAKVYMHAGAIISSSTGTSWTNVKGNWGKDDGIGQMMKDPSNPDIWTITINPKTYFNVDANHTIYRIGMIFREGNPCGANGQAACKEDKSATNNDFFVDLFETGLQVSFSYPSDSIVVAKPNSTINIQASASANTTLTLYEGSTQLMQVIGTELVYPFNVANDGEGILKIVATDSINTKEDSFHYVVASTPVVQNVPAGIKDGINYTSSSSVTLALFLPAKNNVFVIGDFTNWLPNSAYQMKKSEDGNRYWLEIPGLTPGQEYAFQYLVDGTIHIGDPYADKILNENDRFINSATNTIYPNVKLYPTGKTTGSVAVLQTNQQPYQWRVKNFTRPAKENLVIYKLQVRDFLGTHSYKMLADTLSYLKKLGVNAINLMPIMEFAGNESRNNNPTYYLAPDKYYGTKNDLKAFIDKAHQMGMAVILDMVLNQAAYEFPYVKAYWDGNKPALNSPYFNAQVTHPISVLFDFNHESAATKSLIDTINAYWIREYKFDGLCFELAKNLSQKNISNDTDTLNTLDDTRLAIWKRMYDKIKTYDKNAYVILAHKGSNEEEKILADYGLMLWGNMQPNYKEAALGYDNATANLNWVSYKQRNWNNPNLIACMESHNEERLMYEQQRFGNSNTAAKYNTKSLTIALDRMKLASVFYFTIPGPKMVWPFSELRYDLPNCCPDSSVGNNCRVANTHPKWEYLADSNRNKLYKVYAELIRLKTTQPAFQSTDFILDASGRTKCISISHTSMNVHIIGNFGVDTVSANTAFVSTGKWYDYFNGDSISVADMHEKVLLQPGEFHLFTTTKLAKPESGIVPNWRYTLRNTVPNAVTDDLLNSQITVYPNPNAGKMVVKLENDSQNTVILNLYDLRGRIIQTMQLRKWQPLLKQDMNFEKLSMGVYLLEIINGNKKAVKKIYKN